MQDVAKARARARARSANQQVSSAPTPAAAPAQAAQDKTGLSALTYDSMGVSFTSAEAPGGLWAVSPRVGRGAGNFGAPAPYDTFNCSPERAPPARVFPSAVLQPLLARMASAPKPMLGAEFVARGAVDDEVRVIAGREALTRSLGARSASAGLGLVIASRVGAMRSESAGERVSGSTGSTGRGWQRLGGLGLGDPEDSVWRGWGEGEDERAGEGGGGGNRSVTASARHSPRVVTSRASERQGEHYGERRDERASGRAHSRLSNRAASRRLVEEAQDCSSPASSPVPSPPSPGSPAAARRDSGEGLGLRSGPATGQPGSALTRSAGSRASAESAAPAVAVRPRTPVTPVAPTAHSVSSASSAPAAALSLSAPVSARTKPASGRRDPPWSNASPGACPASASGVAPAAGEARFRAGLSSGALGGPHGVRGAGFHPTGSRLSASSTLASAAHATRAETSTPVAPAPAAVPGSVSLSTPIPLSSARLRPNTAGTLGAAASPPAAGYIPDPGVRAGRPLSARSPAEVAPTLVSKATVQRALAERREKFAKARSGPQVYRSQLERHPRRGQPGLGASGPVGVARSRGPGRPGNLGGFGGVSDSGHGGERGQRGERGRPGATHGLPASSHAPQSPAPSLPRLTADNTSWWDRKLCASVPGQGGPAPPPAAPEPAPRGPDALRGSDALLSSTRAWASFLDDSRAASPSFASQGPAEGAPSTRPLDRGQPHSGRASPAPAVRGSSARLRPSSLASRPQSGCRGSTFESVESPAASPCLSPRAEGALRAPTPSTLGAQRDWTQRSGLARGYLCPAGPDCARAHSSGGSSEDRGAVEALTEAGFQRLSGAPLGNSAHGAA